jgi:ubiquinone/menaquinone biosynthesis C-methylase UbiE
MFNFSNGEQMEPVAGASSFHSSEAYDLFMGRYSGPLASAFADAAAVSHGQLVLDVGCGPGALVRELIDRVGIGSVCAIDPSAPFVQACSDRFPGVDVRQGQAEVLGYADAKFDAALAQLVLHFVSDPPKALSEMRRVVRPGGMVAVCVWDAADGMELLRLFANAALAVDPLAPLEVRQLKFGNPGELRDLFSKAGLVETAESTLSVASMYESFEELWNGFLTGIGPAGAYCVALGPEHREAIRAQLFNLLGSPDGPFALGAVARSACGRVPA